MMDTKKMRVVGVAIAAFGLSALLSACAEAVTAAQARLAAKNWLATADTLGEAFAGDVGDVASYEGAEGAGVFYVASVTNDVGEAAGFVVLSGDTRVSPVVAFSGEGEFVATPENPLYAILSKCVAQAEEAISEAEAVQSASKILLGATEGGTGDDATGIEEQWANLLTTESTASPAGKRLLGATPSDIRVSPLLSTAWGQQNNIYNLYTPNKYPCGCVATATAQVLYYWKRPTFSITVPEGGWYYSVDGAGNSTPAGTVFGPWDWSAMADSPSTTAQKQAVGKLCHEIGKILQMNYASGGSGTHDGILDRRLVDTLGFASKQYYINYGSIDVDEMKKCVIPSLEAGYPVIFGISNSSSGHEIVNDGYGYSGSTFYMHLNMGWDGTGNSWYTPPKISAGGFTFTAFTTCLYNVYPEGVAWGTVLCGRVYNANGSALSGQTVYARHKESGETYTVTTKSNGSYAFTLPGNGDYVISSERSGLVGSLTATSEYCHSATTAGGGLSYYPSSENSQLALCLDTGKPNESTNLYDLDITINQVQAPTVSPESGTYFDSDDAVVTLSCATSGATIRYTLDGSEPTSSSSVYSGAISLGYGTFTVKAKAFLDGCNNSETVEATYYHPVQTPTISPETGTYFDSDEADVSLECATSGATIRYTLDGSEPTSSSSVYSGVISLGYGTITVKAKAFADDVSSDTVEAVYTHYEKTASIELTPESALVSGWTFLSRRFTFSLSTETSGATIHYTLDGTEPTEYSPVYTGTVEIECGAGDSVTVKVKAYADGYRASDTQTFTITRATSEHWIEETEEAHEATGWWWPERTDYASDGLLYIYSGYGYHPNDASDGRRAVVEATMRFSAIDEADALLPEDDAKAAIRIGPDGCFELWTRNRDGRLWMSVEADGVTPELNCDWTFRFALDTANRVYTCAIVVDGEERPLVAATGRRRFDFATGEAGSVSYLGFEGTGAVRTLYGDCDGVEIQRPDGFLVIIR